MIRRHNSLLAQHKLAAKDDNGALNLLKQAILKNPENGEAWANLGDLYRLKGDIEKAKNAYEKALEKDPHNPDFLYKMGQAYRALNDKDNEREFVKGSKG